MDKKRYNSDGEELSEVSPGIWIPKRAIISEEQREEYYKRFEHPKINLLVVLMAFLIIIGLFILGVVALSTILPVWGCLIIMFAIYFTLFFVFINKIAIFAIKMYQRFAPMRIREKCVFTPTCSSYAIQAIRKYGLFKALPMIKNRLKRCKGEYREDPLI